MLRDLIYLLTIFLFVHTHTYAEGMIVNKKTFIEAASISTHVARLQLIDYHVYGYQKQDIGNHCAYFFTKETYKVLTVYKGRMPKQIIINGRGEYCNRFNSKIHNLGLKRNETSIMALVKRKNNMYARIGMRMKDTPKLLKIAKQYKGRY